MTTPSQPIQQRHDIHKYRETIKCTEYNWIDFSDIIESVLRERGLWGVTSGIDATPSPLGPTPTPEQETAYKLSLSQFEDRSYAARNQILQNLSPELRNRVRSKKSAVGVWLALKNEFESSDPENVDLVRRRFDNFTMATDMTIPSYIDALVDMRERLDRMKDPISDSAFAARLLRGLPSDWTETARTIRQITSKPEIVMQKLKLEDAARQNEQSFLNPNNLNSLTGKALIGHRFGETSPSSSFSSPNPTIPTSTPTYSVPTSISCKCGHQILICNNCYLPGHLKENCFKRGGGKEGQWTPKNKGGKANTATPDAIDGSASSTTTNTSATSTTSTSTIPQINLALTVTPVAFDALPAQDNLWILNSGSTSHMTHRRDWLIDFTPVTPIRYKSANGIFYVTGTGKVATTFNKPGLAPINVTLNEVLYSADISSNLLSIPAITSKGASCIFTKDLVDITIDGETIGHAKRSGSLFIADCTTHVPEFPTPASLAILPPSSFTTLSTIQAPDITTPPLLSNITSIYSGTPSPSTSVLSDVTDSNSHDNVEDNIALAVLAEGEPRIYGEVFKGPNREKWLEAVTKQIQQPEDLGIWEWGNLPTTHGQSKYFDSSETSSPPTLNALPAASVIRNSSAIGSALNPNNIGYHPTTPIPLSFDNESCEVFIRNDIPPTRAKHIDHQSLNNCKIPLLHVAGTSHSADILYQSPTTNQAILRSISPRHVRLRGSVVIFVIRTFLKSPHSLQTCIVPSESLAETHGFLTSLSLNGHSTYSFLLDTSFVYDVYIFSANVDFPPQSSDLTSEVFRS